MSVACPSYVGAPPVLLGAVLSVFPRMTVDVFVYQVSNNKTFRLEEIPAEELEVGEGELLVPVAHFNKEVYTTFGSPFILKIKQVIPPPPPSFTQG